LDFLQQELAFTDQKEMRKFLAAFEKLAFVDPKEQTKLDCKASMASLPL